MSAPNKKAGKDSSGERAAMSGYRAQYTEFGFRVYDAIIAKQLVEIRVADLDRNVGKLDDICYVTKSEVHGYQVKWSNSVRPFTFLNFFDVIGGIADGWKHLKELYPGKRVYAHLLTNRGCSSSDRSIKSDSGHLIDGGFSAFTSEVLPVLSNEKGIPSKWNSAIIKLKEKTNLGIDWAAFWDSFEFTPNYNQEEISVEHSIGDRRQEDVLKLMQLIESEAAGMKPNVCLSLGTILRRLGWENRTGTTFNHNLTASEVEFEPNEEAMQRLDRALSNKKKGYILLQGAPGSGKSTVLTQWIGRLPNKSVRYYAFDFRNPSVGRYNDFERGDRTVFLFDLVNLLLDAGFKPKNNTVLPYREYHYLKKIFEELLSDMSAYYSHSGIPAIIVVDGLDHVTREYSDCQYNFLGDLPSERALPDGVVFVLGSQHYDFPKLDGSIKAHRSKRNSSWVTMPPLVANEIEALLIRRLGRENVTNVVVNKCLSLSQGHPLYLGYLLNQLKESGIEILDSLQPFPADIKEYYDCILDDSLYASLQPVLGLMCRVPDRVQRDSLTRWGIDDERLRGIRHLFNVEKESLSFFHNSFRQYLIQRTGTDALTDRFSNAKDRDFYKKLYEYEQDGWDAGYYMYKAGMYDGFLEKFTPDVLYEQIKDFRPLWSVYQDFRYGVEIVKEKRDPYLLARYILLESQLRKLDAQDYSVFSLLENFLSMGEISLAKKIVRSSNRLHCDQDFALRLSKEFYKKGEEEEARALFDLSYPSFMSQRLVPGNEEEESKLFDQEEWEKLAQDWVSAAACIQPLKYIENNAKKFIKQIEGFSRCFHASFDRASYIDSLKSAYVGALIELKRWDDLKSFVTRYNDDQNTAPWRFQVWADALISLSDNDDDDDGRIDEFYSQLKTSLAEVGNDSSLILQAAHVCQKIGYSPSLVRTLLYDVNRNDLRPITRIDHRRFFQQLLPFIQYVQFNSVVGLPFSISEIIQHLLPCEDCHFAADYYERVLNIADLLGQSQAGKINDARFIAMIDKNLKWFDQITLSGNKALSRAILNSRESFYLFMVETAVSLGKPTVQVFCDTFRHYCSWTQCKASIDTKRNVVLSLVPCGLVDGYCTEMLDMIEKEMFIGQNDVRRQVQAYKQGCAWSFFHNIDKSLSCFHRMIEESFGISYQDAYESILFIGWITDFNRSVSGDLDNRINWVVSHLHKLSSNMDGRDILNRASVALLDKTLSYDLNIGIQLAKWLLDSEWVTIQLVSRSVLAALIERANSKDEIKNVINLYSYEHLSLISFSSNDEIALLNSIQAKSQNRIGLYSSDDITSLRKTIRTQCSRGLARDFLKSLKIGLPGQAPTTLRPHSELKKAIRYYDNHEIKLAKEETKRVILSSSNDGWTRDVEGSLRLDACVLLEKIDPQKGRQFVFDIITNDLVSGNASGMVSLIDEIIQLLTDKVDDNRLFQEQFAFMNHVFPTENTDSVSIPVIDHPDASFMESLTDWLVYLSDIPVLSISKRAEMQLASLIEAGHMEIVSRLDSSKRPEELKLEIGMFLRALGSNKTSIFESVARGSIERGSLINRIYARTILDCCEKARHSTSSPCSMTFETYIDFLSKVTKGEKRTIKNSLSCLRSMDTSRSSYAVHLDRIIIPCTSIFNHEMAKMNALMEMTAEMIDSGRLDEKLIPRSFFAYYDFNSILLEEHQIPSYIPSIGKDDDWFLPNSWVADVSQSRRLDGKITQYEKDYILAEFTRLMKPAQYISEELFWSWVLFTDETGENATSFERISYQETSDHYLELGENNPNIIIARDNLVSRESVRQNWIALNPKVAASMEWLPTNKKPFGWVDKKGKFMVWSVYWQIGNPDLKNRANHEVGDGWLVVASRNAIKQLGQHHDLTLYQSLKRQQKELSYFAESELVSKVTLSL